LWMGYVGAFRRSELAGLLFTDVKPHQSDGLHVRVRRSKVDQSGLGHVKVVPYGAEHLSCPVCAYLRWHEVVCAHDTDGRVGVMRVIYQTGPFTGHVCGQAGTVPADLRVPVFRSVHRIGTVSDRPLSGAGVHAVIRRRAAAAGYTPEQVAELGGHSLRAGFVTEAISNGATTHEIMRQTGHTSPATVEIYAREHAPIENNAVTRLGL
ncbi:MAG: site-specific integrase, partial [Tomitella sp.]|nr:site-specific integrase [Tomitella sp.]